MTLQNAIESLEQAKKEYEEKRDAVVDLLRTKKISYKIPEVLGREYYYSICTYVYLLGKNVQIKLEGFYVDDNGVFHVCGHLRKDAEDYEYEGEYLQDATCYDYNSIVQFAQMYIENRLAVMIPRLAALVRCDRALTDRVQDALLACGVNLEEKAFPKILHWADTNV